MKLTRREKTAIVSGALAGLALLSYVLVVSPLRDRERRLRGRIAQQRELLRTYQRAAALEAETVQELKRLRDRVLNLERMLLNADKDYPARSQLGTIVDRLAAEAGIMISTGYPAGSEARPTAGIQPVQYTTTFNCDEKQLTQALVKIANHEKLLRVASLEIRSNVRGASRAPAGAAQLVLVVTLTVEGYYKPAV